MLTNRIIPCLDIKNGRTVKGVNFKQLRDAGDAVALAKLYCAQGADELVFLDITATAERRQTAAEVAQQVGGVIDVPFTIGGGIGSVGDARAVLAAGADKVALNSAAVARPELVSELAAAFGSQAVVVAIDAKANGDSWEIFTHGGKRATGIDAVDFARTVAVAGAGEILLTSMNRDGTKQGFDIALTAAVSDAVSIPVIASGGVGTREHFAEVFQKTAATAALAASVFHFGEIEIAALKEYLRNEGIAVRL